MVIEQKEVARALVVPNAQIVGLDFVKEYYNVLVSSPQSLNQFYEDRGTLNRPSLNGQNFSLTTVIQQQITSPVDIKTVDSQTSLNNGVVVLVSGSITFIDNATRSFTQTFFLAPRENGYLVFNDIFRYLDEETLQPENNVAQADPISEPVVKSELESQIQIAVVKQPTTMAEDVHMARKEVATGSAGQFQKLSAIEEVRNQGQPAATQETPTVFEGAPEKSQGLNVKEEAATRTVALPSNIRAVKHKGTAEEYRCSVFISSLPAHITPREVAEAFKKFGAIKPSGVHVRNIKGRRSSYAFLEFEDEASVNAAIQAPRIRMGARNVSVRAKLPIGDREGLSTNYYSYGGEGYGRSYIARESRAVFQGAPEKSQGLIVKEDAATQTVALPSTIRAFEDKNTGEESRCSIFISNLPIGITPPEVEEEFKKFGAIKPSGVQVRTMKGRTWYCYAFVEFEDAASVQFAIQEPRIRMGARKVHVYAKRSIGDREGLRDDGPITISMAVQDMGEAIS